MVSWVTDNLNEFGFGMVLLMVAGAFTDWALQTRRMRSELLDHEKTMREKSDHIDGQIANLNAVVNRGYNRHEKRISTIEGILIAQNKMAIRDEPDSGWPPSGK